MSDFVWCSECGERHPSTNIELTFERAQAIAELSDDERTPDKCRESHDLSALWGSCDSEDRYFVRGVMPFAVREQHRDYSLGVWVEVEKSSFDRILELWKDEQQSEEPPFSGRLANLIPFHESTLGLLVDVRLTGPNTRPQFFLRQSTHMLYLEQVHGISLHQAAQYTGLVV
jgi:hypothetical protein